MRLLLLMSIALMFGCQSKNNKTEVQVCNGLTNPSAHAPTEKEKANSEGFLAMKNHPGAQTKMICSGLWVSNRKIEDIQKEDLFGIDVSTQNLKINSEKKEVRLNLGTVDMVSFYRNHQSGCSLTIVPTGAPVNVELDNISESSFNDFTFKKCESKACKVLQRQTSCSFHNFNHKDRSLLVFHKGQLVSENYAPGFNAETPQQGWSMTKSVLSTLVGLRLEDLGLDINYKVSVHPDLPNMPVWRLLQMESGLDYAEEYNPESILTKIMFEHPDTYSVTQSEIKKSEKIVGFNYSTIDSVLLSKVYENLFNGNRSKAYEFAYKKLFEPLNMKSAIIESDGSGLIGGGGFMYASSRDWAKFGMLFLNNGVFNNQQVLSPQWVDYATTGTDKSKGKYGAHWWTSPKSNAFFAVGILGQSIEVYPDKDLMIVRHRWSTDNYDPVGESLVQILSNLNE